MKFFYLAFLFLISTVMADLPTMTEEELLEPGHARAPTMSTGACLNQDDYNDGWARPNGVNGFDAFKEDLTQCSSECSSMLVTDQIPNVCGGFGFPACDAELIYTVCVANCSSTPSEERIGPTYSVNCAFCIGELSNCVTIECLTECATGGGLSEPCVKCTEEKCNNKFQACSGLDPSYPEEDELPMDLILGVSISILVVIFLLVVVYSYATHKAKKVDKHLSLNQMAALSKMQQAEQSGIMPLSTQQSFTSYDSSSYGGNFGSPQYDSRSNPGNSGQGSSGPGSSLGGKKQSQPSFAPGSSGGSTPFAANQQYPGYSVEQSDYQKQYEMQQQQIAGNAPPGNMGYPNPNSMGNIPPDSIQQRMSIRQDYPEQYQPQYVQEVPLLVKFDFIAERNDELSLQAGEMCYGMEEQDEWWLARGPQGEVGLIPSTYVERQQ